MRPVFLSLLAVLGVGAGLPVQSQNVIPARPDPGIRGSLEAVYASWRVAMERRDLPAWERSTSLSRQIQTRNRIVSQKAPFPEALFSDPIASPPLGGLVALGVFSTGETATSTYFGRANFGASDIPISDNLLVLQFHREDDGWKFDKLRLVKTGNDGEILLQIRNQDFSFLRGEEFQPEPLPPIPQPVSTPDFIGELWVSSIGYDTEIRVNGHLCAQVSNGSGKDLVMGGVRRGTNFHFRPGAEVPPLLQETFTSPQ